MAECEELQAFSDVRGAGALLVGEIVPPVALARVGGVRVDGPRPPVADRMSSSVAEAKADLLRLEATRLALTLSSRTSSENGVLYQAVTEALAAESSLASLRAEQAEARLAASSPRRAATSRTSE